MAKKKSVAKKHEVKEKKMHRQEEKLHHRAERAMKADEKLHKKMEKAEHHEKKHKVSHAKKKDPKKFIQSAIKHPCALHEELHVPKGKKIPAKKLKKAEKASGKLGQRARFAETLKKINKKRKK